MSLVTNGWWLSITLIDGDAGVCTKRYMMRSADATEAAVDAAAIVAALDAITDAVISKYRYGEEFHENAFAYPAVTVKVEEKASITCLLTSGGAKKANLKVPAPVIGIFMGATGPKAGEVDVEDTDLVTYGDLFKTASEAYISDGEDLDEMLSGVRIHAKSNAP